MKKFLVHLIQIISSNIVTLLVGILSTLVVPHILSKYDFGIYRTFYLYTPYAAFLHFGFIDGILLKHSGDTYNDLNKYKFRSYSKIFICTQLILSIVFLLFAILSNFSMEVKQLMIFFSVYSCIVNIITYYQYISKSILRFTELSLINTFQALCNMFFIIVSVLIVFTKYIKINFEYYITSTIFVYGIIMFIYIYKYKELTLGYSYNKKKSFLDVIKYIKMGISLTVVYQLLTFMINLDNQFILMFFNTVTYSDYAFTYSMALLITTFFGSLSGLLLPYMKRQNESFLIESHDKIISVMLLLVFLLLLTYIPLRYIVIILFHKYVHSLNYAVFIFPGLAYSSIVESFIFNSFLYFKKIKSFFVITIFNIFIASFVLFISYLLTHNSYCLSAISVVLLLVWYVSLETYLGFLYNIKVIRNIIYSIVMSVCFVLCMKLTDSIVINGLVYFALYVFISLCVFRKTISCYIDLFFDSRHADN